LHFSQIRSGTVDSSGDATAAISAKVKNRKMPYPDDLPMVNIDHLDQIQVEAIPGKLSWG
jgi:hypothetical protein